MAVQSTATDKQDKTPDRQNQTANGYNRSRDRSRDQSRDRNDSRSRDTSRGRSPYYNDQRRQVSFDDQRGQGQPRREMLYQRKNDGYVQPPFRTQQFRGNGPSGNSQHQQGRQNNSVKFCYGCGKPNHLIRNCRNVQQQQQPQQYPQNNWNPSTQCNGCLRFGHQIKDCLYNQQQSQQSDANNPTQQ